MCSAIVVVSLAPNALRLIAPAAAAIREVETRKNR